MNEGAREVKKGYQKWCVFKKFKMCQYAGRIGIVSVFAPAGGNRPEWKFMEFNNQLDWCQAMWPQPLLGSRKDSLSSQVDRAGSILPIDNAFHKELLSLAFNLLSRLYRPFHCGVYIVKFTLCIHSLDLEFFEFW